MSTVLLFVRGTLPLCKLARVIPIEEEQSEGGHQQQDQDVLPSGCVVLDGFLQVHVSARDVHGRLHGLQRRRHRQMVQRNLKHAASTVFLYETT